MARVAPGTATMTRTPGGAPTIAPTPGEATMTRLDDAGAPTAAMIRLDEAGPSPQSPAATTPAVPVSAPTGPTDPATSATTALPATPALPAVDPATWRVEPGDSLWAIAEDVVRTARADAPDRAVARYWRSLVEANRAELVDPGNHDLLVPGQQLVLPPFAP
jgi:nucleoid-associated protein YgaU